MLASSRGLNNYSWPLDNTDLNSVGPLPHRFFFNGKCYSTAGNPLVESAGAEPWVWKKHIPTIIICRFSAAQRVCTPNPGIVQGSVVIRFSSRFEARTLPQVGWAPPVASWGLQALLWRWLTCGPHSSQPAPPSAKFPFYRIGLAAQNGYSLAVRIIAQIHYLLRIAIGHIPVLSNSSLSSSLVPEIQFVWGRQCQCLLFPLYLTSFQELFPRILQKWPENCFLIFYLFNIT